MERTWLCFLMCFAVIPVFWPQGHKHSHLVNSGAMDSLFFGKHCCEVFLLPLCSHSNHCWPIQGCQTPPPERDFLKTYVISRTNKVLLTVRDSFLAMVFQKKFVCPDMPLTTWKSIIHTRRSVSVLRRDGKLTTGDVTHKMFIGPGPS